MPNRTQQVQKAMAESNESVKHVPRLVPDRALPPYAHTPGVTPHPIRDPDGHSFGESHPELPTPESPAWRDCDLYLWGIDLFNAGYYWEAHEAWEAVWITAGRSGVNADFFKALIKLTAAGVKLREANPGGARRHLRRAGELLTIVSAAEAVDGRLFGLELAPLQRTCRELFAGTLPDVADQREPLPVLGISLIPR